ncbi:MAG: hypothetical protein HN737_11080, partial [Desulfobacterales bacterium]|nr:hypothetical protein [Desulfobacterales bacterium]
MEKKIKNIESLLPKAMHADAILVRREIINIKRSISRKKNKEKNLKRLINLEKSL